MYHVTPYVTRTAVAIQFIEAICPIATWRSWILGYMRLTEIAKVVYSHFRKKSILLCFTNRLPLVFLKRYNFSKQLISVILVFSSFCYRSICALDPAPNPKP